MDTPVPISLSFTASESQRIGVIWISGYSAAGKSTVGRIVERRLRDKGVRTIYLDGDHLRSIFGNKWGYLRSERIDLARVYFRLCAHLASQGLTVVIAAVAMYDEVRAWIRSSIPNAIEVYLNVPEDERRRRDKETKNVYNQIGSASGLYDEPTKPDLTIDNFGGASPDDVAARIVDCFLSKNSETNGDFGRAAHWHSFYSTGSTVTEPSRFAINVASELSGTKCLLEVGCGNGRDASYFCQLGHDVTALDVSEAAIQQGRRLFAGLAIKFVNRSLPDSISEFTDKFDVVYSRFCLHAMTKTEEVRTLQAAAIALNRRGRLYIECRSINDPLANCGEVISTTERIFGHYRRFIVPDELKERLLGAGFYVLSLQESKGLAMFKDEDPVVIRAVAEKRCI